MSGLPDLKEIATPKGSPGLVGRLLSGPALPALAARFAAARTAGSGRPWRFGSTVVVIAHEQVSEALSRDLEFTIAPVNAGRIEDVDQSFILGMDRGPVLAAERKALYRALSGIDFDPIRTDAEAHADECIDAVADKLDVVGGYARLVAAGTARKLFGVTAPDDRFFVEVARSVFGHTFLNLSNDGTIRDRAVRAAALLDSWIDAELDRRRTHQPGTDMMGRLLADGALDAAGIRRTLAGMLVGAIDTTASAVAKIVYVIGSDASLRRQMEADCDDQARIRGWCLDALRRWPHNPILIRHAARDTSLGGADIAAGDRIFLWTQAAMQDASAFPDPRMIRPDRPADAYLHFGGTLHHCAGRSVNVWQIPLLVSKLLGRGISRVGRIGWAGPFPDSLPVGFAR